MPDVSTFASRTPARISPKWVYVGWGLLTLLALCVGLVSLRYALPRIPFPAQVPNFRLRRNWLIAHATFSSIALLSGPWQFLPLVRERWLTLHRRTGQLYCGAVVLGWISSLPISAHASTGRIASAGFLTLGLFWIVSTVQGYRAIRTRRVSAHREWMVRSYALTAAAITLRLYLGPSVRMGIPYAIAYPVIAWACWIPNLLFAEWLVRQDFYNGMGSGTTDRDRQPK